MNCSSIIFSSRFVSESKSINNSVSLSSLIFTDNTSLISRLSATALTGLFLFSKIFISTSELCGIKAPFHLLGLKADIGVKASRFEVIGRIGR